VHFVVSAVTNGKDRVMNRRRGRCFRRGGKKRMAKNGRENFSPERKNILKIFKTVFPRETRKKPPSMVREGFSRRSRGAGPSGDGRQA
jgi:hypothetical protein